MAAAAAALLGARALSLATTHQASSLGPRALTGAAALFQAMATSWWRTSGVFFFCNLQQHGVACPSAAPAVMLCRSQHTYNRPCTADVLASTFPQAREAPQEAGAPVHMLNGAERNTALQAAHVAAHLHHPGRAPGCILGACLADSEPLRVSASNLIWKALVYCLTSRVPALSSAPSWHLRVYPRPLNVPTWADNPRTTPLAAGTRMGQLRWRAPLTGSR